MSELSFYNKEPRPWPNPLLTSASIIGHTTDTTCRLWVRVYHPAKYWLVVSKEPFTIGDRKKAPQLSADLKELDGQPLVRAEPHKFTYDTDITHVFDLVGLEPETTYYYAVFAEGKDIPKPWELGYRERLSFRTRATAPRKVTFGFHSCHMPYEERNIVSMNLWDEYFHELTERNADFVIGGGDQVYVDGNDHISIWKWLRKVKDQKPRVDDMLSWYRDIYRGYWGHLSVRRILRSFPHYMIWDDHEIMDGWGSYTEDELSNELDRWWGRDDKVENLELAKDMFKAAKQVYYEYQHSHNPATGDKGQFDYEFDWGPAAFYVLDMRGERNYNRKTSDRILGPDQMGRFREWLGRASDKDNGRGVLFIVTPVPVVHASSFFVNKLDLPIFGIHDDLRDEWEHESNWEERDNLLDAVFQASQQSGKKVFFLSGDVHLGASFQLSDIRHPAARVHQLTSSGITYAGAGRIKRLGLKLAVADSGTLKGTPDAGRFAFKRLSLFHRHNFALISVEDDGGGRLLVHYDLYGAPSSEDEAIVRLKRITL